MNELDSIFQYLEEKEAKRKANRKPSYRKPDSIKELERMHLADQMRKYPNIPIESQGTALTT